MRAHQGESHPGIPRCGLKDGSARLQQATLFGVKNHAERCPILDATAGIE